MDTRRALVVGVRAIRTVGIWINRNTEPVEKRVKGEKMNFLKKGEGDIGKQNPNIRHRDNEKPSEV